ncbi:hypothetical protein BN1723_006357 [Verticillium longisporum]|uniref:FMN hydroxy acid dehydrogenase domain-containing protein n=1 Tax=Verticillium longisporum TaxID=100787 RepID=A0A0G4NEA3_VERLO|nr:hypothetical protein BN1723_006357 [Verticillium longisporum]
MSWSSTKDFCHPLANINVNNSSISPAVANQISYMAVEWMTWQGLGDVINAWRQTLDLEDVPFSEGAGLLETLQIPFTYCWSPALIPKPLDWPNYIDVCGFFFRDAPQYTPEPELDHFLRSGPAPVYIGFGSIVIDDPDRLTAILVEAVKQTALSVTWDNIRRAERAGAKAIVFTIDAPGNSVRHRAARYDTTNANSVSSALTWDVYDQMRNQTSLPIILKGITTAEDALLAVEKGAKAIYISNHGGRQLDHTPGPLEIAYEIYRNAPQVFQQVEVLADSGIRYGSDVLKLLALGVKAVGMGRPFMYSNVYGLEGVTKAIDIMRTEIVRDGAQLDATNLQNISTSFLNTRQLESNVYLFDQ